MHIPHQSKRGLIELPLAVTVGTEGSLNARESFTNATATTMTTIGRTSAEESPKKNVEKIEDEEEEVPMEDVAVYLMNRRSTTAEAEQVKPKLKVSESGKFEDQFYHTHEGSRAMGMLKNRLYLKKSDKKDSGKQKKNVNVNGKDVEQFSESDIIHAGYLVKQGSFWRTWRRRYFILRRDVPVLCYYTSLESLTKLGEITIDATTTAKHTPCDGFPFKFTIEHSGRKLVLVAELGQECLDEWLRWINYIIQRRANEAAQQARASYARRSTGKSFGLDLRISENGVLTDSGLAPGNRLPLPPVRDSPHHSSMKRNQTDSFAIQMAAHEASHSRNEEIRKSRLKTFNSAPPDVHTLASEVRPRLYRSYSAGCVLLRRSCAYESVRAHDDNGISTLLRVNQRDPPPTRAPSLSLTGFKPAQSIELAVSVGSKGIQDAGHMLVVLYSAVPGQEMVELSRTEMQGALSLRSCGGDFYARDFNALLSVPVNTKEILHFEIIALADPNSESINGQQLGFVRISPMDVLFSRDSTIVLECRRPKSVKQLHFLVMERIVPNESINLGHSYTYAKRYFIADTVSLEKQSSLEKVSTVPSSLGLSYAEMMRGTINPQSPNHVLVSEELSASYVSVSLTVAYIKYLQRRNLARIKATQQAVVLYKKEPMPPPSPTEKYRKSDTCISDPDVVEDVEQEMAHYMRLHALYLDCEKRYQVLLTTLEEGKEQGITGCLKRSTMKKDKLNQFMPTNLNCHLLRAKHIVLSSGTPGYAITTSSKDGSTCNTGGIGDESVYSVVTHGCAAAHALGFKDGGLRRLQAQLAQSPKDDRLREKIEQRQDVVQCQILAIAGAAFMTAVGLAATRMGFHLERLNLMCSTGFFLSIESLLSTVGGEKGMLEDMSEGVRWLNNAVSLKIVQSVEVHQHLKCSKCIDITSSPSGNEVVAVFAVPKEIFDKLPSVLQQGHELKVHAVLFTQGINEMQTVANHVLDSSLQDEINYESVQMLERYFGVYQTAVKQLFYQKEVLDATSIARLSELAELQNEINSLTEQLNTRMTHVRKKNVNILIESSDICRKLGAGRTTCCKSGKDRTAMSVTLESSRILVDRFNVKQGVQLCNAMRERGVRRVNVLANTGKDKYAFNTFQLKYIPDCYKPPMACADSHVAS